MNNKANTILNICLTIAVIVLFILFFTGRGGNSKSRPDLLAKGDSVSSLPVAYVNLDSLLRGYNFSRDLNEKILRKSEAAQAELNQKGRELEAEMAEFQKKWENNAFLNAARAESEQQRILKKQRDFQELNQRLTLELQQEQDRTNKQLSDTVRLYIREYNQLHGYQIIFSNALGDNILFAQDAYDITGEVVDFLNSKYVPEKK